MMSVAFMTSCGTVGLVIHTLKIYDGRLSYNYGHDQANDTIHFVINKNNMLLKAEINGKTDTVMYDSGVNSFALLMYTPSTKPEGMKFYRHSVSGADKKSKIKITTLPVKIGTDMVVSEGLGITRLINGKEVFKVGDQIVSVNGETITEENICHYYDLLSESKDWSEFDIKVK